MLGIIPSTKCTYEVYGTTNDKSPIEGKLYYDKSNGRLYYYSLTETRSNPKTGYFPIWDGKKYYISQFSKEKYFDKDVKRIDIETLASSIDKAVAKNVLYMQRKSDNGDLLKPQISDEDNMFTQCIKGVICQKNITIVDLIDMAAPKINQNVVESYYSALTKITFMRYEKWSVWIDGILHLSYKVKVFKDDKRCLTYNYPEDVFETGIVKYDNITKTNDDPFKKIVKLLMIMENITKASLRSSCDDDYTVNNLLTTVNNNKPLSAQLFSRFIRIAGFSYSVQLYENGNMVFEFNE